MLRCTLAPPFAQIPLQGASERQRPDALQLATAFRRAAAHKVAMGCATPVSELVNESITSYNKHTLASNSKITGDERKAVKMLMSATKEFERTVQSVRCLCGLPGLARFRTEAGARLGQVCIFVAAQARVLPGRVALRLGTS